MTICGVDYCKECSLMEQCGGCDKCQGHPCGGSCVAAEEIFAGGKEAFEKLKQDLISELNALCIPGLKLDDLNLLMGSYVNLSYPLPNGTEAAFLKDNYVYLGNQIEKAGSDRCLGVICCREFILAVEYGFMGAEPEILLYKKRQ